MKSKGNRNPRHYRLDFISENTFNRLWSVRMTTARTIIVAVAAIAAAAALFYVIVAYTPLRRFLPGSLDGDLRADYVDTALRLDSLQTVAEMNSAYLENIRTILADTIVNGESAPNTALAEEIPDSILAAGEAEREFLRRFNERERFNLSVLAPIAAEGMVFAAPVAASVRMLPAPGPAMTIDAMRAVPVTAVYRGTVTGVYPRPDGRYVVVVQHPNDFVSVYDGLGEVYVDRAARVAASQRLGDTPARGAVNFEMWHGGTALDPREYVPF